MKKNVIFRRKKSIHNLIDDFLYENELKLVDLDENFGDLLNLFQNSLDNEKNDLSQILLKEIEHQKEEIIQKKEYIWTLRRNKANELNQLIIQNRLLKRNIQKGIDQKNSNEQIIQIDKNPNISISFHDYHILSNKQAQIIKTNKEILLQVYKQIKKIKNTNMLSLYNKIDKTKLEIKNSFHHLQDEIDAYKRNILAKQDKIHQEQFKSSQEYYFNEINKIKLFNNNIIQSFQSLSDEFNAFPIEFAAKEIQNKAFAVGQDAIKNELSKIIQICKRINTKSSAKIIIDYIVNNLKQKDKSIINLLREKENSCSILKEKLQQIEIKQKLNFTVNGSLHSTIWNQSQSEIAKNIHDIKLMQKTLFEY